jgi:hypothetical protein
MGLCYPPGRELILTACDLVTHMHPLLFVLLLLFDDMLYCVTKDPKVEAGKG